MSRAVRLVHHARVKRRAVLPLLLCAGLLPGALTAQAATVTAAGELRTPVWTTYDKRVVPNELFSAPVAVKGRRPEGLGALGRGEGVVCLAAVVITRGAP